MKIMTTYFLTVNTLLLIKYLLYEHNDNLYNKKVYKKKK